MAFFKKEEEFYILEIWHGHDIGTSGVYILEHLDDADGKIFPVPTTYCQDATRYKDLESAEWYAGGFRKNHNLNVMIRKMTRKEEVKQVGYTRYLWDEDKEEFVLWE
ncbi:MAG: hypothetical protein F4X82_01830 [Candidatus Spechtbacteria bacterium SB0662_bin_43]|uniref:Uncharacterized protein n=1 Tax=Candidatus Spechtbacteria bacterium SB0662_bin_43 TaxID=2604897 RepID=A0A845D9S8_9BACT|nr:hypothetical protein [Candidatus Spechtbacteria bacterium SB0662_bin_43]